MSKETITLNGLPFRLGKNQAAAVLGFKPHDITILISSKHLKTLGEPSLRSPKYFATKYLIECGEDETWMNTAMKILQKYWKANHEKRGST